MNAQPRTRRWKIRFGLRTLLLVPMIVGAYLALGEPTKTQGVRDVRAHLSRDGESGAGAEYTAPLLLESPIASVEFSRPRSIAIVTEKRSYYLWFFGLVAELPFSREITRELPQVAMPATTASLPDANGVISPPSAP